MKLYMAMLLQDKFKINGEVIDTSLGEGIAGFFPVFKSERALREYYPSANMLVFEKEELDKERRSALRCTDDEKTDD